jgi:hypothetical protein
MVVIGLNPSTADESLDDPTIRRCLSFARREICGGLVMLNLFAIRATDPKVMLRHSSPVGPQNDAVIQEYATSGGIFVAAWGAHGPHLNRAMEVRTLLRSAGVPLYCLGRTKSGSPRHPLYLKADAPLSVYQFADEKLENASSVASEREERTYG